MIRFRGLWGFVILAFLILLVAWGSLIKIATKNRPESIPVETKHSTH